MATPERRRRVFRVPLGRWLTLGPIREMFRRAGPNNVEVVIEAPEDMEVHIEGNEPEAPHGD